MVTVMVFDYRIDLFWHSVLLGGLFTVILLIICIAGRKKA